jgi:hypothetical protein
MEVIKREDISDRVYKRWGGNEKYKHKHVEIDGVLYLENDNHYVSCEQNYLNLYKIDEFKQSSKCFYVCKCLNNSKFQVYVDGWDAIAKCLECDNEIVICSG